LGAEFIHGSENEVWPIVEEGKLDTHKVPHRHWRPGAEGLVKQKKFWDKLEQVFSRLNSATPDQDFRAFLDQAWSFDNTAKKLALDYVEGFHAAPADRIGVHALAKAEAAAERENGTRAFRLRDGYGAMVSLLARELERLGVRVSTETTVRRLYWEPGHVEAVAETPSGERSFRAGCAVITLPLGVLHCEGPSALVFEPGLPGKQRTIQGLAMGTVVKVTLQFRARFWRHSNFGFIHSDDRWFRTWWSDERGPVLTGWSGGPRAERLACEGREAILSFALQALAQILNTDCARIKDWLVASHYYDWSADEFSRGAYSYTPVGMEDMPRYLGAPVKSTLFFAGEATDTQGDQGTVHGALRSGSRVAREILGSRLSNQGLQSNIAEDRVWKAAA
jgi:monoamine oxidase